MPGAALPRPHLPQTSAALLRLEATADPDWGIRQVRKPAGHDTHQDQRAAGRRHRPGSAGRVPGAVDRVPADRMSLDEVLKIIRKAKVPPQVIFAFKTTGAVGSSAGLRSAMLGSTVTEKPVSRAEPPSLRCD